MTFAKNISKIAVITFLAGGLVASSANALLVTNVTPLMAIGLALIGVDVASVSNNSTGFFGSGYGVILGFLGNQNQTEVFEKLTVQIKAQFPDLSGDQIADLADVAINKPITAGSSGEAELVLTCEDFKLAVPTQKADCSDVKHLNSRP